MTTRELSLIPKGGPQGARAQAVADHAAAGVQQTTAVSDSPPGAPPLGQPTSAPPPGVGDPLLELAPQGFDAAQPSLREQMAQTAITSQNPAVREAMRRILRAM